MMYYPLCFRPSAAAETGNSVTTTEDAEDKTLEDKTSSDIADKDGEVEEAMEI